MEIKAQLLKPCSEQQKRDFIVKQNQTAGVAGYIIKETSSAFEAWGYSEEEIIAQREQQFKKEFFRTSLGWIRRKVTKADGNKADFLLDYVPAIKTALEMGLSYNIITYDKPDFNEDVIDWTQYQHFKPANATFIQECLQQIANDFLPQS